MQFLQVIVIFVLLSAKVQCSYPTTPNNIEITEHRGSRCAWSEWGYWSECSTDCGTGTQTRRRQCECGLLAGTCEGDAEETRKCEASNGCDESECQFGEWSEWSVCSDTCHGLRYRKQMCQCGAKVFNDSHCKGLPIEETEVCNSETDTIGCCNWEWINNWSNANSTCCPTDGKVWRRQACMCAERGLSPDAYCALRDPFQQERKRCVEQPNCRHKPTTPSTCHWMDSWAEWSPCSVTRGLGSRYRSKQCSCGDPQLCPYPAPLDTESCIASSGGRVGVWAENNVTSQCDTPCGVGAYWIGATCVCEDTFCDIDHCLGIPRTHRQVCVGHNCPSMCEWQVTVSSCDEDEVDEDEDDYNSFFDIEGELETDSESYHEWLRSRDVEQLIDLLDEMEKKFFEEKKNLLVKHRKNRTQVTTRRCLCDGVEVNNQYCSPALDVYEEKPCHKEEACEWKEWSSWSPCDSDSEEGKQTRTRTCSCDDQHSCKGSHMEERSCVHHEIVSYSQSKPEQNSLPSPSLISSSSHVPTLVFAIVVVNLFVLMFVVITHIQRQNRQKQLVAIY